MKTSFTKSIVASTLLLSTSIAFGIETPKKSSVFFQENKGQICDQNSKPRPDVLFSGVSNEMVYHLTQKGVSYQLSKINAWNELSEKSSTEKIKVPQSSTVYRVDINWIGINQNSEITTGGTLEGLSNYYLPHCEKGALNVKSFSQLTYNNIYDGIDLKWYDKNGELEYDFIVAANADASKIAYEIKGAERLRITKSGELEITTPLGTIIEKAPYAYQGNVKIKTEWKLNGNQIGFKIAKYNHSQALIIDPMVRTWGTYYGGAGDEYARSSETDAAGNVYVVGYSGTSTSTIIATTGSHQSTYGGGALDAYFAKFNSTGTRLFSTYYGGTGVDFGIGCAIDLTNSMFYISGYTSSATGISTVGSHQAVIQGTNDAYLAKFNLSGVRQWATYYGGSIDDYGYDCSLDGSGNVYMCGNTSSPTSTNIASPGAHQTTFGGGFAGYLDAFIVKFNAAGTRQWGTYFGGAGSEGAISCAADNSGNIHIAGSINGTSSTGMVTTGAHQTSFGGASDAYLAKFNSAGVRQWCTLYGGSPNESGQGCTLDATGNIYFSGNCSGNTNVAAGVISTPGAHKPTICGGNTDMFLTKFNSAGVRQWGTYYGDGGDDYSNGVKADASGYVYIYGYSGITGSNALGTSGGFQPANGGGIDAVLTQFNSLGSRLWGTYYGGALTDYAYGCSLDASGNLYLVGMSGSTTNIASGGSHQATLGGGTYDAYIAKFSLCGNLSISIAGTSTLCAGQTAILTATSTGLSSYLWSTGATSSSISVSPTVTTTYTINASSPSYTNCVYSDTQGITVTASPTLVVTSLSICPGANVVLVGTGATTYSWSTGATTSTVALSPTTTTIYTLTGTNAAGCSSVKTPTVFTYPTPSLVVNSSTTCAGQTTTLQASGAAFYSWSTGSGASGIIVSPTVTTTYTVIGTSVNSCTAVLTPSVTVKATPTVAVSNATICSGTSTNLIASGASTYSWSTGATTNSVSVSPMITTNYTVVGTNTLGCSNTKIVNVFVAASPTLVVNNYTICAGGTATLTASGAVTYSWNGSSSGPSITVSPTSTTIYTVTGSNTGTCLDTRTVSVTVGSALGISLSPSTPTICIGNSGTITATGASTYTWSTGSNATSIIITPTTTTIYTVTGTSGTCNGTNTISIAVSANPTVAATSSSSLICTGNSATLSATGASSYNWNPGSLSGTSVVVSPTINTTYTVVGSNAAGCTNTRTVSITVSACTGINEAQVTNGIISIYPNPNNGEFTLTVPEQGQYSIINSIGQTVEIINVKEDSQTISVQGLADGIYYVIGKSSKAKIVVSK